MPAAVVVNAWVQRIQSYCPTLNSIGTNTKNNHKYRWWRDQFEKLLGPWLQTLPPAQAYRRVTLTRLYGKGKRPYDRENYSGGCKPLVDTLTNYGALYDDSETWCERHYLQSRSPDGVDYIEIKLEELQQ